MQISNTFNDSWNGDVACAGKSECNDIKDLAWRKGMVLGEI